MSHWIRPMVATVALLGGAAPGAAGPSPEPAAVVHAGAPVLVMRWAPGTRVVACAGARHTLQAWLRRSRGLAAINGGFFNHSDGGPVSHVVAGGRLVDDPRCNAALMANRRLQPHLPAILDGRSAWLAGPSGWQILPWGRRPAGVTEGLQAGPALLPAPALSEEAFRVALPGGGVRDGIQSLRRAPRSALGLDEAGAMVWVAAGAPGLTVPQLAELMRRQGCTRALALDGGSSTGLAWIDGAGRLRVGPAGQGGSPVRSVLVVVPGAGIPR